MWRFDVIRLKIIGILCENIGAYDQNWLNLLKFNWYNRSTTNLLKYRWIGNCGLGLI